MGIISMAKGHHEMMIVGPDLMIPLLRQPHDPSVGELPSGAPLPDPQNLLMASLTVL